MSTAMTDVNPVPPTNRRERAPCQKTAPTPRWAHRAAELLVWFPAEETTIAALVNDPPRAMVWASAN